MKICSNLNIAGKIKVDNNFTFSDVREIKVKLFKNNFWIIISYLKENEDYQWTLQWTNIGSDYSGDKDKDGVRAAKCSLFANVDSEPILNRISLREK